MDYEDMLKKGRERLPQSVETMERFEIPKVRGHLQGNRTVISNFYAIAETLGRDPQHVLKYILKEVATPGELTKSALIMGSKIPASRINEKIEQYTSQFVFCPACKSPDTKLEKHGSIAFIQCLACGARNSIKTKI
ncbi:MAG: translation initiation factor IF-2 subunit beta [archaeon]